MSDIDRHDGDDELDLEAMFARHKATAEPLDEVQVRLLVQAGICSHDEWSMRGGNLWWHDPTFPEPEDDETLPIIQAGEACPACGGRIVVDGACNYVGVPVYADGTPTDEASNGGDFEWSGDPYCADCGVKVQVE